MRYAVINGSIVENIALADAEFAAEQGWLACPDEAGPGWTVDAEGTFSPPAPAIVAPEVPEVVTMRQARLAMLDAGILEAVNSAIEDLPSPQKEVALIEWDHSAEVRRDNPLVTMLGVALDMTDEQIDALFISGVTR